MFYEVIVKCGGKKNYYVPLSLAVMASCKEEAAQIVLRQKGLRRDLGNPVIAACEIDCESYMYLVNRNRRDPIFSRLSSVRKRSMLERLEGNFLAKTSVWEY